MQKLWGTKLSEEALRSSLDVGDDVAFRGWAVRLADTDEFLCGAAVLEHAEIRMVSPAPEQAMLYEVLDGAAQQCLRLNVPAEVSAVFEGETDILVVAVVGNDYSRFAPTAEPRAQSN